nr:hydroxyisourate hydrolase [Pseudonocardia sp. C8]
MSSHVLDAVDGRPATGVAVELRSATGEVLGHGTTDDDGRVRDFGVPPLAAGDYRVVFASGDYFATKGTPTFYPTVEIPFTVSDPGAHYHVPLLLSPFAYSTYRGS